MSLTTTYEVYVEKGDGWSIASIFNERHQALDEARALIDRDHVPSVQVIEERFDAGSGETKAAIVFRGNRPSSEEVRAGANFKRQPATVTAKKRKTKLMPKKPQGLFPRLVFTVLVLGAGAIGLLVALAAIVDKVS